MAKELIYFETVHYINNKEISKYKTKIEEIFKKESSEHIRDIYLEETHDKRTKGSKGATYEKIRIRLCGKSFSCIRLESICRFKGKTKLKSDEITYDECMQLLFGKTKWMLNSSSRVIRSIGLKSITDTLFPKTVYEFFRETFSHGGKQKTKITLDSNFKECNYVSGNIYDDLDSSYVTDENTAILKIISDKDSENHLIKAINI